MDISNRDLRFYEKRSEARYQMACECNVDLCGTMYDAEIKDISFNGVAFMVKADYKDAEVGDKINFKIFRVNYPVVQMMAYLRNITRVNDYTRLGMQVVGGDHTVWDPLVRQAQGGL